ncbi:MAG: hypothetical protein JST82_06200 [Bacteroidetes bacterium]|nr:hypothetical protein [Bacteroidota bacterium]
MKRLMLSCEQASFLIVKKEEKNLSVKERMLLWMHLSMCSLCKMFAIQNKFISDRLKHIHDVAETQSLSDAEKRELSESIK